MALPNWLDQVSNISFEREKELLHKLIDWLIQLEWSQASGGMDFSERQQADLVFTKDQPERKIRVAVLPKSKSSQGALRIQAIPTFSEAEYRWRHSKRRWEIEIGGVPMDRYDDFESFEWLLERLFAK